MPKQKSNFQRKPLSSLQQPMPPNQQLIDSLTSHISLYNSRPQSNPNPKPRSSILKWFSSLTPHQRQSHLTAVDPGFVRILVQMLGRVATRGHGTFIILPDLPSPGDNLPGLCYRQSRGLLSRAAESDPHAQLIFDSARLFNSKEGDDVKECSVSVNCLDSVTVGEELVQDLDLFVGTMDGVSKGEFLRGEVGELGEDWVELGWLKSKGYYSISAFLANRLEVALRLAWLSCNSGKKRGVKLKEKVGTASVSANVFWRKKGCMDWWRHLDSEMRRKALTAVFGKSANNLILEILNQVDNGSEDMLWAFSGGFEHSLKYGWKASSSKQNMKKLLPDAEFGSTISGHFAPQKRIAYYFNRLFVLQNVITMIRSCFKDNLNLELQFFSTLGSLGTLTDCILRKLRGFLIVMYLDHTKRELLEEQNCSSLSNKIKEKSGSSARRKKGKSHNSKRVNSITTLCQDPARSSSDKSHEELKGTTSHFDITSMESTEVKMQNNQGETSSSAVEMETVRGSAAGKLLDTAKKNKKGKRKNRHSAKEVKDLQDSSIEAVSSCISQDGTAELGQGLNKISQPNTHADDQRGKSVVVSRSSPRHFRDDATSECSKGNIAFGNSDELSYTRSECSEPHNDFPENGMPSCLVSSCKSTSEEVTTCHCSSDNGTVLNSEGTNVQKLRNMSRSDPRSAHPNKKGRISDLKGGVVKGEDRVRVGDQTIHDSSSACQSQEWPSVTSHSPSPNSHLPPATDRLHLDVGRNWQNHFHQPFLPTIHQTKNPPIENGCKQILTQPLPMSLDWPPVVRVSCNPASSVACSYDSGFIPRRQTPFHQGFSSHSLHLSVASNNEEKKYSGDFLDKSELMNMHNLVDECDGQWISEEEFEVHGVSGLDYNQYFGGGIMYWNPSDHAGTGFSRPPSLSSDDSFWTWQEADMNRAVDDMVAFSSSYSTNGLASPTAASFCSPFDPLSSGHQALGYVMAGGEVPGLTDSAGEDEGAGSLASMAADVDGKAGDSLSYPVLRPIIIPNISRERSKRNHDLKSACIPPSRREKPRIKRPPSPVVLCVPRAPRPPPPSPVGDARKHRGFPTVRSGSSSPRHWGVRGWHHDNVNFNLEEGCARMDGAEVFWPSWRKNNLSTHSMIQPLPGPLLQDRLIAISQLARDQEHPDVAFPLQPPDQQNCPMRKASLTLFYSTLHDEIDSFWKKVVSENLSWKPYINWAVKRVTRSLQVLWPRSRTNIYGSNATGLALPTSDVDLVVCLPPVRNLEPIKEAGILEGRNGIKETCLQHAARCLANQEWVKNDSLKTVENTAIPIIMLEVEIPPDLITSNASCVQSPKEDPVLISGEDGNVVDFQVGKSEDSKSPGSCQTNCECKKDPKTVRLDISFKSASHTGLQTTELVRELTEQFPAATPLALLLKQFLADRSLDHSYSGGLSSYCLVLLITRFLQHEHHLGRSINQNFGSLLMDFLYFFGNVFDPRQMRVSVRGSGIYMTRERGHSIDPIHIDDPLCPTNNVGRNCFRIHQCIKAFSEAYSLLEQELSCLSDKGDIGADSRTPFGLLQKIIPGVG